jgi:hypothetical protein
MNTPAKPSPISARATLVDRSRDLNAEKTERFSDTQLFDPRKVLVIAEKRFGAAAAWMDIESVWALLKDEVAGDGGLERSAAVKPEVSDLIVTDAAEPSYSWLCQFFCGRLRVYEGGRPDLFGHLETCRICGSRVAVETADHTAVAAMIDKHLL